MNKDITEHFLCIIAGFILLCLVYQLTTWELTVIVMFFWLCYKIDNAYYNQRKIIENQRIIVTNQKPLINNQQTIVNNQETVVYNQIKLEKYIKEK